MQQENNTFLTPEIIDYINNHFPSLKNTRTGNNYKMIFWITHARKIMPYIALSRLSDLTETKITSKEQVYLNEGYRKQIPDIDHITETVSNNYIPIILRY